MRMNGKARPVPRSESGTGLGTGMLRVVSLAGILLLASVLLAACGGEGLTRAEVRDIVREEMPASEPGLTRADVEEIVRSQMASQGDTPPAMTSSDVSEAVSKAMSEMPKSEPGITRAEVEEIVRAAIAGIPPRSAPAEYTMHFVESAIARYETQGREATLAHYNREESVDGQWYVFIIDENDLVIGHPDSERRGLDLKGWVGTDANGYNFGPEMLSATEDGKWVSYVYRNPEDGGIGSGDFELKNVWVDRHDGLLFASGWYIDADEFTKMLVSIAVDNFREGGLPATVAYFASPGSALAGLEAAIDYYNAAETVDGRWSAFIGDPSGKVVAHSDPAMIGKDTEDLLDSEPYEATEDGVWVESESLRIYVAGYDGFVFASGWSREG